MFSNEALILWVFTVGVIGAWILQRRERRKRRVFIESERDSWTDLK